jgi:Tfp pilus assembly protein PilF
MSFRLWESFKDPDKRAILSWLGGGAVVAAGGIWAVFTFVVEHKDASGKKGGTVVTLSGQGIASGGDTNIGGNVTIGLDVKAVVALVARLIAERQTPPAPGEEKRIGEAVQSIAQEAASDTRLQQALDLLKTNKTAEAARLLSAFAEDKTARIDKDRKETGIAYRNLGAIAGLRDPKAAREAYARAVALDPENAEGLFWDGWFQLQAKNLAAAEKSYRVLVQLAGKGVAEHEIFWARTGLGDIAVARGDLTAALAAYGEARAAMERLAAADAGNADWQRDLSVSNDRIGDVLVKQGNLPDALKSYRAGLVIAERLAASDAGDADWQRDLAVSFGKLASAYRASGDRAKARDFFRQGQTIMSRLTKISPDNAEWKQDLAVFDRLIAELAER